MLVEMLLAQTLMGDPDMSQINKAATEVNSLNCIREAALAFAQFSSENAESSAKYAVISCRDVNKALTGSRQAKAAFLDSAERVVAARIAQWRVRAAAKGPQEYDRIADEFGLKNEFEFR